MVGAGGYSLQTSETTSQTAALDQQTPLALGGQFGQFINLNSGGGTLSPANTGSATATSGKELNPWLIALILGGGALVAWMLRK